MPSVYCFLFSPEGNVLIGTKQWAFPDVNLATPRSIPSQAGQWALPGGGLHPGESTADGASREFREETGIDIDPVIQGDASFGASFAGQNASGSFSVQYARVSEVQLRDFAEQANANIQNALQDIADNRVRSAASREQLNSLEFSRFEVVPREQLAGRLGVPRDIADDDVANAQAITRKITRLMSDSRNSSQDIDWYQQIANSSPNTQDLNALADAAGSGSGDFARLAAELAPDLAVLFV